MENPGEDMDLGEADLAADLTADDLADDHSPDGEERPEEVLYETATVDAVINYQTEPPVLMGSQREILLRIWYSVDAQGPLPIILVSHGGSGSVRGHTRFQHLGREFAQHGYLSIHLNHPSSSNAMLHPWDRPHDVSQVLDALESGELAPPPQANFSLDRDRIGHIGHSWGAYTAHAVSGASLEAPVPAAQEMWHFRDTRIRAMVALSPQGWDQFGSYDEQHDLEQPSGDNSWATVSIPSFNIIGESELDGVAGVEYPNECSDCFRATGWRLFPFVRYPADGQRYVSVLPGKTHTDLGGGEEASNQYIATNARLFFDVYLKEHNDKEPMIGEAMLLEGTQRRRK